MASSSGGKRKKDELTVDVFRFTTKLEASVIDKHNDEYDEDLEDQQEVEDCLANINQVKEFLNFKACYRGISDGLMSWTATSEKEVGQFCKAVKEKKLQKQLTKFVAKQNLKMKLKLEGGMSIDIDITIENAKALKKEAKSHFEGKICVPTDTPETRQDEPRRQSTAGIQPPMSPSSTTKDSTSGKGSGAKDYQTGEEITKPEDDQRENQSQNCGQQQQPEIQKTQDSSKLSEKGGKRKGSDIDSTEEHQRSTSESPLSKQRKEDTEKSADDITHNKAKDESEKQLLVGENQQMSQNQQLLSSATGTNQRGATASYAYPTVKHGEVNSVQVVLYVVEDRHAYTVKMEYKIEGHSRGKKTVKMKYSEPHGLWFSGDIDCPSDALLTYAFDIYKYYDLFIPSCKDEKYRQGKAISPFIRSTFGDGDCLLDSYAKHVLHIIELNRDKPISSDLQDIDKFTKNFIFNREKRMSVFLKLMSGIYKSTRLNYPKAYCVVGYIFGKLDTQFLDTGAFSSDFVSKSALIILESFLAIRQEDVSKLQMLSFRYCAEQMCKRAFPSSACLLLMLKYCLHLFPSEYFRRLYKDKVFTFSSGVSDNDTDLRVQLFNNLVRKVEENIDTDANYLFDTLVEDTPLNQILTFEYERYPNLVERVDGLLASQIKVEVNDLRRIMKWKNFEELCTGISKHPSLVEKYSQDLTKLALQFFRSVTPTTLLTDAQMHIVESPALFTEGHDRGKLLLVLSKSGCPKIQYYYLEKLDRVDIEASSIIAESACEWLDTLINSLRRDEKYKTPADFICVLYEKLNKLLTTKKVSADEKLVQTLKEKVCGMVGDMDLELVLSKSLERGFSVHQLFFQHLQEIADHRHKGREILRILESILSRNAEGSFSR